ncbi:uncharacterized protein LOC117333588 [Pecten maximus]|uniref:uncharacterized protein LOC117333588 n=1 Tax=Pecten maximus TaxID=6579 RepID=UPI001458F764|nr:uncharacterized protein LOC117333588 [Pecten maximus]XP_033748833.1 uncharacterized protein LOC117333588 [Pecten maximus]
MRLYAFHNPIPLMVYLTGVVCLDVARADTVTDGRHTPDLANFSTIQNRSDFVISKESASSTTFHDTDLPEWLDGYQTEPKKKSNLNLAFLPGLAVLFLFIFVFFRACKWYRESSKIKERGCSYDVASYVILVQGDKNFHDVDIGDNYDTVNSFNSYLRSGAYETITSSKSLQYRMDSQMYDTVTSYSNYLQKIEKESNLEIELKEISSDGSPSPKRTYFTKKSAKCRVKLPQESRFSIKPALDNYMRLKGANQKSPMSPKSVRYDSVDRIDGTPRKMVSKTNVTVNAASSESLLQSNRTYGRQMSTDSQRSSPARSVVNIIRLENLRRSVSEDTSKSIQPRDEIIKKTCSKIKNSCSTSTDENREFIQNNLCNKPVRMVDAETQCQITSPSLSSKRRGRVVSLRSDTEHDSDANDTVKITSHVNTAAITSVTAMDQIAAEKHTENSDNLPDPVVLDDLQDNLSPPLVKPTVFSVCAVVHNVDTVAIPSEYACETQSPDNNPYTNRDSEMEGEMKNQDMDTYGDKNCQSNGLMFNANGTDNTLIENEKLHPSMSNGLESRDYKKSENGCCQVNGTCLPSVATLSSEGSIFEKSCLLSNGKGNTSHCIARRSSFQNMSKSKHDSAIEIQNELSQGAYIEMVH